MPLSCQRSIAPISGGSAVPTTTPEQPPAPADVGGRHWMLLTDETVWLSQQQLAGLFHTSRTNITEHIKHI